ncbi:MAG: FAD:protein FMN transferase [Pyrinomonadaceae bacterium]|nr:FAD:protein FMN transferase [Pyrinomonadaceae bacterium]
MISKWYRAAVICLLLPSAYPGTLARTERLDRFEFSQPHMGTEFRIVLYAPDARRAAQASDAAFKRVRELDSRLSDYRETSELMSLCRQAGGGPVKVSDDLLRVLLEAQKFAEQTTGAFDVTAGPLVRLWRRARRRSELPDPVRLSQARELVGFDKMHVDERTQTVRLAKPGMLLDLGAIAKGYAADCALAVLKQHGVTSALVAVGGDIAVSAPPPGTRGWVIGIASLDSRGKLPRHYLSLRDAAVSTSGDAQQYVEIGGVRYSHIIDPRTGQAIQGRRSVTVVAPNGMTSDALDTAANVLDPRSALELIDSTEGAAALIVQAVGQSSRTFESKRWHHVPKGAPRDVR